MTESKNTKRTKNASPLIGSDTRPATLDNNTTLDIDTKKILVDNIIEAGLTSKLDISALENFTSVSNSRDQIYQLVDTMAQDSSVAAILRTYAEDVCEPSDSGHIIWCESSDPKVSKFINYMLNVMNADKNMYSWTYSLLKYGDVYLRLFRESDYEDNLFSSENVRNLQNSRSVLNENIDTSKGQDKAKKLDENVNLNIHEASDTYSYYVEQINDPGTMFELTKFGKTYGYIEVPNENTSLNAVTTVFSESSISGGYNFKMKSTDVNVFQADDFVHACLEDNFSRFPETVELANPDDPKKRNQIYNVRRGKSLLYDSYKIWREKALLENAALLNRITRSSIVRKVGVEVGDMPKEQVQLTLRRVKEMMEQKGAINVGSSMSEYNNPGPIENNIYFATHGGQGNITVDSVGGDVDVKNLADLDWWNNKFYSSYGIPKQYFGWTDDGAGFNGGTSLTILSSVYAKGVKRVQNAMIQALTDAVNLFLLNKGLKSYLNNFTLKMKSPATQEEIDYRNEFSNKINAISNLQGLFTDVEDKSRRLRILKELIGALNYGDNLNAEIDAEIRAYEEAERQRKAEESLAEKTAEQSPEPTDQELGTLSALESLQEKADSPLLESNEYDLKVPTDILLEDSLPTPEELDSEVNFSENN